MRARRPAARQQALALARASEQLDVRVLQARRHRFVLRRVEFARTVRLRHHPHARALNHGIEHRVAPELALRRPSRLTGSDAAPEHAPAYPLAQARRRPVVQ